MEDIIKRRERFVTNAEKMFKTRNRQGTRIWTIFKNSHRPREEDAKSNRELGKP